ncbi:MAG: spermidine/putrescine ABC transporter permease PotB [Desulfobacteraceae bacterium 4572_88]|nr:MAG: spermidine/putrescine ABC transporter permease PotB [Desulfobacteraceae bacterium 4572_88]RLC14190.1 MAG: spermidine/putrescine ABC transporter permease PotB [Deltaproteobacteria bacterium]
MTEKSAFRNFAIFIVFFWILAFVFFPNLLVLVASFMERDEIRLIRPVFSLENYRKLSDPIFFRIFTNSFFYAFITTLLCLLISYPFAYMLTNVPRKLRKFLLMLVILPFWTSSLIRTYSLIILLKANGLLNTLLIRLGLIEKPLSILYTDMAVFIGLVYALLPFMILPLYAAFEKLDKRLLEAASDLGAGTFQIFAKVIVPLTMPGIISGCILVFLPALGLFYIPDLLGGAKSMLIGNFIKNQFLTARAWPFGSAASVILTLVMGLLLYAYYQSLRKFNASVME